MAFRKGQVAAEYLATYGWALFAMFIVLSVLISSGLLGPGRFTSEECTFAPNLPCTRYWSRLGPTDDQIELHFNITNTQGFPMLVRDCRFNLTAGSLLEYNSDPICGGYVPQGGSVDYVVTLQSNSRVIRGEPRKILVGLGFKNCAAANSTPAGIANCFADDVMFPMHNTSGRLLVGIRG